MTSTSFKQTIISPVVCEKTTSLLELQLTDENDATLAKSVLTTLTLRLYNRRSGAILNSRNAGSILDANGGSVTTSGFLSLVLSYLDNALTSQDMRSEEHVALIEWSWSSGTRFGKKEITFTVVNQAKVI